MKRSGSVMRVAVPVKMFAQRFTPFILVAAAIGLLVLGRAEATLIERVRMLVVDAFAPILEGVARPMGTVATMRERVAAVTELHEENLRLREENERLLQWQSVARRLEAENRALRDLLRFTPEKAPSFVSARVIGQAGGSFVRSILVTAGARDGVVKGQAAVTGDGLVGRVTEVGDRAARVLLLTDLNSQIPIVLENSRYKALLVGDNTALPRLQFLPADSKPEIGERVTTSGHGGVFPPGLPVGVIVSDGDSGVRVRPYVDFDRLEYLRLVDYGLGGTLPVSAPPPASRRGHR